MIRLDHACFAYGEKQVLKDLSLTIPKQGITVICGPSGTGKTTLLRILAGLERLDSGTVSVISPKETAFLFQEDRLLPWRTVRQHITDVMPRKAQGSAEEFLTIVELAWAAPCFCWTNPSRGSTLSGPGGSSSGSGSETYPRSWFPMKTMQSNTPTG